MLAIIGILFEILRQNWNKDAFMDKTEKQPGQRAPASETRDSPCLRRISTFDFCH